MSKSFWIHVIELGVTIAIATAVFLAWRADRADRALLAAQLAAAQQTLAQADARQHDRDAQLSQTLASINAEKHATATPDQMVRSIFEQIGLPAAITIQPARSATPGQVATVSTQPMTPPTLNIADKTIADTSVATKTATKSGGATKRESGPVDPPSGAKMPEHDDKASSPPAPEAQALIPAQDLKPLYDFALDCKACQAKLSASQADLADEKTKTVTLTRERDQALTAAKGGSTWRRIGRAAKWFVLGAAAGAVAARAAH